MNTPRLRYLSGAISALLIVLLVFDLRMPGRAAPAAPTFSVNSPADIVASVPLDNGVCETAPGNGVCTLRAAIMKANHYPGGGATINFELPGVVTYTLTLPPSGADDEASGDLNITNTLTIIGHGAGHTIIDGNLTDRVLAIDTSLIPVTISGVTVENGRECFGGGISSGGRLTLVNSTVSRNAANCPGSSYGGGIYSVGALTITHSTVSGNTAGGLDARGAGVYLIGELTLVKSTVSGNISQAIGGGLYLQEGSTTITGSTINENTAGGNGGGTFYQGSVLSSLVMINSTVSGNNSSVSGGGIYNDSGTTSLFNVTLTGNLANADASGAGIGGGVATASGAFNFRNSIIAGNYGIVITGFPSISPDDCAGIITSQGNNIMNNTDNCTVSGGGVTLADPMLGPIANNGDSTLTHALLTGSPAIDAGNAGGCTDNLGAVLSTDQRGFHRPIGLHCDIGAVEAGLPMYLPLILR